MRWERYVARMIGRQWIRNFGLKTKIWIEYTGGQC
jgi:hypothetical protein